MKKCVYLLLIFLLLFSCVSVQWDKDIPEKKKADFLIRHLNEEYEAGVKNSDLKKLNDLLKYVELIESFDKTRFDDKELLIKKINESIINIKAKKFDKARGFVSKKDFYNASLEFIDIKEIESQNKEITDFFKNNKNEIELSINNNLESIEKMLKDEAFQKAKLILGKLGKITTSSKKVNDLMKETIKLENQKLNTLLNDARSSFEKKDYKKSLTLSKLILDFDNNFKDAGEIFKSSFLSLKVEKEKSIESDKTKKKKSSEKEDNAKIVDTLYKKALELFNMGKYSESEKEIKRYLDKSDDKKGRELEAKIKKVIKEISEKIKTILGDAILNYNSEKYENALNQFKEVLSLDPDNEEALEYKSRIEKRIKAFE